MDLAIYQATFPGFPLDEESIQRLGKLLVERELLTDDIWQSIKSDNEDPAELVKAIASLDKITPKELARIEADILNVAFIDLEETTISSDTFKLIELKLLKERKIIPIKINGQELLIGCVSPANTDLLTGPGMPQALALRPCKILIEQFDNKISQMAGEKTGKKKGQEKKRLGDILIDSKYITDEQLGQALKGAKAEKMRMGAYLVKQGMLTNKQLSIALSKQFNIPFVDLDESLVDPVLATLLPKKLCYEQILCPVKREDKKLVLAMTDPTDIITIDHVEMMTGMRVSPVVSSELSIVSALGNLYGESIDSLADGIGDNFGGDSEGGGDDDLGDLGEDDAPIIKLVNMILTQAVHLNVSDIHIEVYEHELRIRFRQDGTLKLHMTPAKAAHAGVVSRIKVMANLDIAETRRPQDGRIKLNMKSKKVDLRVSCIPCVWGEKVVMRICDQGNLKVNLSDLGFEPFVLETYMEGVKSANGIVLVTGPTGSGKTTTLYSSLFLLNNPAVNIMTAEDPVEYNLMGINQVQCHPDIGLDFAAALRSFLRQDPDIIMLGEIRDFETASIAIKAALTGHLVISTLHTNDAPATVARLLNMGIDPFSLASSLRVVQAQRLVRKICSTCSQEYKPDKDLLMSLGIDKKLLAKLRVEKQPEELVFHRGTGCPDCDNIGTRGRMGIYEVLTMTNKMRILVEDQASTEEMRRQALSDGMLSLRESALFKLIHGNTSVQEVFATTVDAGGEEAPDSDSNKKTAVHKPDTAKHGPISISSGASDSTPVSLGDFTRELHEFSSIISKVTGTGNAQTATTISNDLLKKNIADPLALIKAQASKPDAADKLLPLVQAQGQKMEFNVKNLIAHFSDSLPTLKKIQLNQLVEREIFAKLKSQVLTAKLLSGDKNTGKNLKISKNLPQSLPPVMIDPAAFSTVINNVFVNALLALGSKGGEIKVVTRAKPKTPGRIEFIIFDSGGGISNDNQQKLFIPFNPLGRNTLGLGLAVAKKIVEQHHGKISVKCAAEVSTLVTIELPAAS